MKLEKIKEVVKYLNNLDYKTLVYSIILYEKIDFIQDLDDFNASDLMTLDKIYRKIMDTDTITGLLNDETQDIIDEITGEQEND